MIETYWSTVIVFSVLIILSVSLALLISILTIRGSLTKKFGIISLVLILLTLILIIWYVIPVAKDYKFVSNNEFIEVEAVVVEFAYVRDDLDGNGHTEYSKPKFYIEDKNEYVILKVANVELGKKYKIRYLPNSRICEVVYPIE